MVNYLIFTQPAGFSLPVSGRRLVVSRTRALPVMGAAASTIAFPGISAWSPPT